MKDLKQILLEKNVKFKNGKIYLPDNIKHIKLDIGLSFDAPHSQNWIDNDKDNSLIVFGFEPNPVWYKYLISPEEEKDRSFKDYHMYTKSLDYSNIKNGKAIIIPVALSNVDIPCNMVLYVPELSAGCGSLLKSDPSKRLGNVLNEYNVSVFSLRHFFELLPMDKIEYIDYIKIDVQGKDLDVLKSAGDFLKDKVVYITAEPENLDYIGSSNNTIDNIISYMKNIGFIYLNHQNTSDPTFLNSKFIDKKDEIYIWQKY